ncbi:MAG TPA: O-antigen ligase family protein [Nitrospirota bacterium]|nr:O-antigen ligase family protein [Nitrospirota bacterium]HUL00066.1 O-antigen ligase family protein [Nitrospirota bacterium]
MDSAIIVAVLIGAAAVIFSISPVYGIAFITAFRTLSMLAAIPMGKYEYSAEGFLTLVIIIAGLIFVTMNLQTLKGVIKWPFVIFILYCGLTVVGAADMANFSKKIARLIGYFFMYLMVVQLSIKEKNKKILSYAFIVSIFVTTLPAIYIYYIAPEAYMKSIYSTQKVLSEVGIMSKNNYGFYCCYMVFFLFYMYSCSKTIFLKVLIFSLFIIQTIMLVLSYTRTAWAGFIVSLPFFILFSKNKKRLVIPVLATMIIIASLFSVIYYGAYKDVTEKKEYGFSSWQYRWGYAWPASIKAFQEKPIMGWGLGNDLYALAKAAKFDNTSHNDYLLILVETGLIGISLYLWLLAALFLRTLSGIRSAKDDESRLLYVTTLAIFTSFLVGSLGEHLVQTPGATGYVITILGMAHGTILAAHKKSIPVSGEEGVGCPPLPAL